MSNQHEDKISRLNQAFLFLVHFFHNKANQFCKTLNLSLPQYRMLMIIRKEGAVSVKNLRSRLEIAQSTASEMVDRLVKLKLVVRKKDSQDKRITFCQLSQKAQRLFQEMLDCMHQYFQNMLENLDEKEQNSLIQSMENIVDLLSLVQKKEEKSS